MQHHDTCDMEITQHYQIRSFLGVPIFRENGELFGNLCCFDKNIYSFTEQDLKLLQTMSTFFTYVVELEQNKKKVEIDYSKLYKEKQLLLDSLSEGVFGLDLDGRVRYCNRSALQIVGYSIDELQHNNPSSTFLKGIDNTSIHLTLIDGLRRTKKDETFHRCNGVYFPIEYTSVGIIESGHIVGVVVTFRDITEQKKADELMLKSEKLNLAGQLAAGISHEIRNPLTAIKGFFQLIKSSTQKEEYFTIIDNELERIEEISSELLMLAKPQSKTHEKHNLYDIINEVKLLLETQAIMKSISVHTEYEGSYLEVVCDKTKIKQVFINLVKNAIEAMEKGKIMIKVSSFSDHITILVEDDGPGISKERLPRIGEPFYSTKEKGTGLGLLTSYKIIENHNGTISVDSVVGKGTTFLITLPLEVEI